MPQSSYPFWRIPIIVTKPPGFSTIPAYPDPEKVIIEIPFYKFLAGMLVLILGVPDRILINTSASRARKLRIPREALSGLPKRARSNRLYYMYKPLFQTPAAAPKAIPKGEAKKIIAGLRKGKSEGWLYAVWAKSADDARLMVKRGEAFPYEPTFGLAGAMMNCGVWQPAFSDKADGEVWRCLVYGAACGADGGCVPSANKLKQCVKAKNVYSSFYEKMVTRCAKFKPVCDPTGCLPQTMPKPKLRLQKSMKAAVRDVAQDMADDANARTPDLSREIMSRGGIRSHAKGVEKEEYRLLPLHLKRTRGQPLDEIADEMGMREDELYQLIRQEYPGGKRKKKRRRFTWQDFEDQARGMVYQAQETYPEFSGADLFELKREMVLDVDDPATSDDPVMICMQRRGWKPGRVRDMQAKISEKLTPDLFTGKRGKLTGGEAQMQEQIQECLDMLSRSGKKGQLDLFGARGKWIASMNMKKGAFTRQAKRAGMGTQQFAAHVISQPESFTKRTVARARLAQTFKRMAAGEYR